MENFSFLIFEKFSNSKCTINFKVLHLAGESEMYLLTYAWRLKYFYKYVSFFLLHYPKTHVTCNYNKLQVLHLAIDIIDFVL